MLFKKTMQRYIIISIIERKGIQEWYITLPIDCPVQYESAIKSMIECRDIATITKVLDNGFSGQESTDMNTILIEIKENIVDYHTVIAEFFDADDDNPHYVLTLGKQVLQHANTPHHSTTPFSEN
ncbi:MAG: hypothetical protein WCL18_03025 [bacterium]